MEGTKNLKTRKEVAEFIGISIITLDRKVKDGEIGCFRIGNRVLFDQRHVQEFLKRCERSAK